MSSMDYVGDAVSQSSVDSMIDGISDHHVQHTLRVMQAHNDRQFGMYRQALADCAEDIKTSLLGQFQLMASSLSCAPPVPVGAVVYPSFIQAGAVSGSSDSSPVVPSSQGSNQSLSATSSFTDRPDVKCHDGQIIGLKCLFCPHYHFIEKSHYQHMDRLLTRFETGVPYSGKCVIPDSHWLYLQFPGKSKVEAVREFIRQYLSFLYSGNEKRIDPEHAVRLVNWLDSLHRP